MNKGNVWALLPILVFLVIFLGGGIAAKDMYAIPTLLCFLIALVVAVAQNRKVKMGEKMKTFARGIGNKNIITMVLIFLTAGMFTGAVTSIGGVESTVNFGLSVLPPEYAVVGLFVIGCFISMSMGTSVGTITALAPIGYGISLATGFAPAMCLAAVVSGAMFGDNLSMVSDTTIAAVNTQGCNMKDKFRQNFFIVLPAAIIAIVVFMLLAMGQEANVQEELPYNFWKIVPYIFVLVTAIIGLNVFLVLSGGTILAIIIGLCLGDSSITFLTMLKGIGAGMSSMYDISLISIVVAGIVEIIKANGGIEAIIYAIRRCVKGKKGAQLGIAVLVTLVDFFTANNTVAIVIAGPIAKDISDEFKISPKRSAAILDIFASFAQGIIPYGAQLLAAGSFVYIIDGVETDIVVSPLEIIPYLVYPIAMMVCAVIFIAFFSEKSYTPISPNDMTDGNVRREEYRKKVDVVPYVKTSDGNVNRPSYKTKHILVPANITSDGNVNRKNYALCSQNTEALAKLEEESLKTKEETSLKEETVQEDIE